MSWDFEASKKKAILKKKWIFGDKFARIGDPFKWVDGDLGLANQDFSGVVALLQWYSGYYEEYPTLEEFKYPDYEKDFDIIKNEFHNIFDFYFPFLDSKNKEYFNYIKCNSLASIQDLCVLKNYAKEIFNQKNICHLDFGSGIGGASIYSLKIMNSVFTSIEAHKFCYDIQRLFYRKVLINNQKYLDIVAAEIFSQEEGDLKKLINSKNFNIKQIPSWFFEDIENNSQDLVTATRCLNEINDSGIIHFIINADRVLKNGGYMYFRDSNKRKPGRNLIDYDEVIEKIFGYQVIKKFDLINRKDIFSIPRLYKKIKNTSYSFEELFNKVVGFEAITSHGGYFNQNIKK
jgi:SAM-dependent methyltransferase